MNNDLISREALMKFPIRIEHYDKENGNLDFVLGIECVLGYAESLPAVDAVEVVHAKWEDAGKNIHGQKLTRCSHCKGNSIEGGLFCRNCSARMDGE